jgi:hypothetical protein
MSAVSKLVSYNKSLWKAPPYVPAYLAHLKVMKQFSL